MTRSLARRAVKTVLRDWCVGSLGRLVVEQLRGRYRVRALVPPFGVQRLDEVAEADLASGAGLEAALEDVRPSFTSPA